MPKTLKSLISVLYDKEHGVRRCFVCGEIRAHYEQGFGRPSLCSECLTEALLNECASFQKKYAVSSVDSSVQSRLSC